MDNIDKSAIETTASVIAGLKLTRTELGCTLALKVTHQESSYLGKGVHASVDLLPDGGKVAVVDCNHTLQTGTLETVQAMFAEVKLIACKDCGAAAFDPTACSTNRNGFCETCFMTKLRGTLKNEIEQERQEVIQRAADYKRDGFTHRVDAVIHPVEGDDEAISFYIRDTTSDAEIVRSLAMRGSVSPHDFVKVTL